MVNARFKNGIPSRTDLLVHESLSNINHKSPKISKMETLPSIYALLTFFFFFIHSTISFVRYEFIHKFAIKLKALKALLFKVQFLVWYICG